MDERNVTDLIQLGRDREAAELAASAALGEDRADHQGGPMDVLEQLDGVGGLLAGVTGGLGPEDLDRPTPCSAFTVRGVLEHMIGGATMFAAAFRGTEPGEASTDDVLNGFEPALGDLVAAIREPGALDRTVQAPFGPVPGETFARFVVLDGLVHGWDLAVASGQAYAPPDDLVAEVEAFARDALTPLRDGSTFADATTAPEGATPMERLAAFTGRQV